MADVKTGVKKYADAKKIVDKADKIMNDRLPRRIRRTAACIVITLLMTLMWIVAGLYVIIWICVNGPSDKARHMFVASVKETSAVGFLAHLFVPDIEIKYILASGEAGDDTQKTDTGMIEIPKQEEEEIIPERPVEKKEEDLMIEDVIGPTYRGKMVTIKDPSRVFLGISGEFGEGNTGRKINEIADKYGAVLAVNGGGFNDAGGNGNGGTPIGIVISEGVLRWGNPDLEYDLIGFDRNNILIVDRMTGQEAINMGIRDAVSFGPFLIKNGEPIVRNKGINPRTAIGQRADGAVLILVIEGRKVSSMGATMQDLVNVMQSYGAVNAANLDGGSSSALYYKGEFVIEGAYIFGVRDLPDGFCVRR